MCSWLRCLPCQIYSGIPGARSIRADSYQSVEALHRLVVARGKGKSSVTYARRVDGNHGDIRDAFRKLGCKVFDACRVGQGFPDLVVQYGGLTVLCEVKTEKGKKTATQEGSEMMARIVRNLEDVAETVATLRKWHQVLHKWEL